MDFRTPLRVPLARMIRLFASRVRRASPALVLALAAWVVPACGATKPTMKLNHAEITGVRIAFPPSLNVQMTVFVDVFNPNSYDIAVRAVRGQVLVANRYTLPVDFRPQGEGVWLASGSTTSVAVPLTITVQTGLAVLQESFTATMIPYQFVGRADVTATRTLQIEKDDYSVNEAGWFSRQQLEATLRGGLGL
jgi:hypothetical protein